ncbi:ATP synthase F0 subunit B [Pseudenhygromyxa sp. WMMC2535]|uniref:F0F1 ATP synthase subunit B family protein n=1 Tax=Pseudenhygromyxa sp. WMMC2535 TaxID=2712867 RepID=UPI001551D021|nr:ATP synthase F0 subunit B [Pseudenhygromyxa sp. WMMC2535]NVB40102.1 ATP synthase F0 subunit B [Pseudenhygromyxa sp. WMMC2535]
MNIWTRLHTRLSAALVVSLGAWIVPALALASPEGHGGEHGAGHDGGHGGGGFKWIGDGFLGGAGDDGKTGYLVMLFNFFLLMLLLNKLLFKNLRRSNAEASDAIRLELERATSARAEAEALVKEYEAKLDALDAEIADIKAEAERSAQAERAQILAEAKEQAEKIRQAALRAGEREAAIRRAELENEIVEQAVARAEAAIRSSFGPADQRRLVDAWVDEVTNTELGASAEGVN